MKIGIIVYSQTGTTLSVCGKLAEHLKSAGYDASIERIETSAGPGVNRTDVKIMNSPDTDKYDVLLFASPVQAFSLAVPMQDYLKTLKHLEGKKAAFLVTKALPFKWTGAVHALSQMSKLACKAGAAVISGGTVIWPARNLEAGIKAAAEQLTSDQRRDF